MKQLYDHMKKTTHAVLIGMVLTAAQVAPTPVSAEDIQTFRNQGTNRCLDDSEMGLRTLADCHGDPHQQWEVHHYISANFHTVQLKNRYTGECIYDWGPGVLTTEPCVDGHSTQHWIIKRWEDRTISFQNVATLGCMKDAPVPDTKGWLYRAGCDSSSLEQSWW